MLNSFSAETVFSMKIVKIFHYQSYNLSEIKKNIQSTYEATQYSSYEGITWVVEKRVIFNF